MRLVESGSSASVASRPMKRHSIAEYTYQKAAAHRWPESRTKPNRRKNNCVHTVQQRQPPSFLQTLTAPVFSLCWLRTESHQTPVRIKLAAMLCDRPGGLCHPRETLVPRRVQGVAYSPYGYRRNDDASPLAAHGLGDSAVCIHSDGARAASKSFK